jgi:aerobic carbon-monoxide dehydrogenase small subunit
MRSGAHPPVTARGRVNGRDVETAISAQTLLIDFLRDAMHLRGVKRSCDVQACGACTVLLDGRPVSACTTLALELDGCDVETVEGMRDASGLSAVQQAFIDAGAIQCGFCTPGFVMTVHALLRQYPDADRPMIIHELAGNICRCSGYESIVHAAELARDRLRERAAAPSEAVVARER